jgi:iduronate 2-sulfatase/deleted-in-malignant-brain-tumors protein 1
MNVLMIAIDDMRPEIEPYGASHMHTPNMQKLADRSTLFSRAYVQVAVCMPSRNALLFSRRPDTAQAWEISPSQWPRMCGGANCGGNQCGPSCGIREPGTGKPGVTLPMWFLQHGFFTTGMGKIFHPSNTQNQDYAHSWTPATTNPKTGIWEAHGGPYPVYDGTVRHLPDRGNGSQPSWYAFPNTEEEEMRETKLAQNAVDTIVNLSARALPPPFFLAVGFHKPHIPWYAPAHYWDLYPNTSIDLAPRKFKPIGVPNIAMQDDLRTWSTPSKSADPFSCKWVDLCGEFDRFRHPQPHLPPNHDHDGRDHAGEVYPGGPDAAGRPGISKHMPYDNTTLPDWKAAELRRAYWATVSYTDSNVGRVIDALDASPFVQKTIIAFCEFSRVTSLCPVVWIRGPSAPCVFLTAGTCGLSIFCHLTSFRN